jgi:thymidylate kinase
MEPREMSVSEQRVAAHSSREPPTDSLRLVRELFDRLNAEDVRYCHWKSNLELPTAMRGETDLDLLIDVGNAHRFREILGRLGCKLVVSDPSRYFPGLEDWLGLDTAEGKLIHLHAHYRLVLGEQLVKNHTIPLEQAYLDTTTMRYGVRVPAPELELTILCFRALLKYRDRDLFRDFLSIGRSGIPPAILREILFLRGQLSDLQLTEGLLHHAPFIEPDLIFDILHTIEIDPRAALKLYRLRRRVRRTLAPFQRYSWLRARAIYYRRMLARELPFHRLLYRFYPTLRKRKTPASGGRTVAIVGVDGAGKSTVVREVSKFLSWRLVTKRYYMGTRKFSLSRSCARAAAVVAKLVKRGPLRNLAEQCRDLLLALQNVGDARARHRNYVAGCRAAAGGAVVIFDRFPLQAIQIKGHAMDGARIASRHSGSRPSFVIRWLARREEQHYRLIRLPDLLVVLHVSADIASARKPDHAQENIAAKCKAVAAIRRERIPLLEVDASRPLEDVLRQIKQAVWGLI